MPGLDRVAGFVVIILVGLIVGVIAKIVVPGKDPGGIVTTSVLGIVGSFLGGRIGRDLGVPHGFALSVAGAILILIGYRVLRRLDRG